MNFLHLRIPSIAHNKRTKQRSDVCKPDILVLADYIGLPSAFKYIVFDSDVFESIFHLCIVGCNSQVILCSNNEITKLFKINLHVFLKTQCWTFQLGGCKN